MNEKYLCGLGCLWRRPTREADVPLHHASSALSTTRSETDHVHAPNISPHVILDQGVCVLRIFFVEAWNLVDFCTLVHNSFGELFLCSTHKKTVFLV